MSKILETFINQVEDIEQTLLDSEEIEIGVDEETNMIIISKYVPEYEAAFHITDSVSINDIDLEDIRDICDERDWSYVL